MNSGTARITAEAIACFRLYGIIAEVRTSGILLKDSDGHQTFVQTTVEVPGHDLAAGTAVTVYYTGLMSCSVPPQVQSIAIVADSSNVFAE